MNDVSNTTPAGSWRQMLEAIPIPNKAARVEEMEGQVVIHVPNQKPHRLFPPLSWMVRPPRERRLILDELGAFIWQRSNGERTVEEVVDQFAETYELEFHEARVSVTGYLKLLVQRGAIAIGMPGGGDE